MRARTLHLSRPSALQRPRPGTYRTVSAPQLFAATSHFGTLRRRFSQTSQIRRSSLPVIPGVMFKDTTNSKTESRKGTSDSSSYKAAPENSLPLLAVLEAHERNVSTLYRWAIPPVERDYAEEAVVVQGYKVPGSPGWALVNMEKCRDLIGDEHLVHPHLGNCVGTKLKPALAMCYGGSTTKPQKDITLLETREDVPKYEEWAALAEHYPSVRWLYVETGFCENWEDSLFPQQWPLEALVVLSSCGETVTTPVILDGRVPHLVLFLTSGMRFEGPTRDGLVQMMSNDVESSSEVIMDDKSEKSVANKSGKETVDDKDNGNDQKEAKCVKERKEIKFIFVPDCAAVWMHKAYPDGQTFPDEARHVGKPPSRMHTLEILENDAADTLIAMALACAHVVHHLRRIDLRSTMGGDFHRFGADALLSLLGQLTNLRELQLSVSDVTFPGNYMNDVGMDGNTVLQTLYRHFPPNLEVLEFRGPPSLAKSSVFQDWIAAFGDTKGNFLPQLKRLSFALDSTFEGGCYGAGKLQPPSEADITDAKAPTQALLDAARKRGITVEDFCDPWKAAPHML